MSLSIMLAARPAAAERYVIREVMSGLSSPRGLAFGPDGMLYVSNRVTIPGASQVLSLTLVPEPSSLVLVGLALLAVVAGRAVRLRGR